MKSDSDFELKYADVLKECIKLFDEESQHEKKQISLALRIGKRVNEIAEQIEDKETVFKRLARDIFKARGKIVAPSKISEYRQLYLNFQSMDTITIIEKSMMSDVTVGMLTEMALKEDQAANKNKKDESPLLAMLTKANRLLDKFEVTMEDNQPDDKELPKILEELELIVRKAQTSLNTTKNAGGNRQMDLFRRRITHEKFSLGRNSEYNFL